MDIILAQPRGFCAGVERAIRIVEEALRLYGPPVYVRHEIVHNRWVVDDLKSRGVIFVDDLDTIPEGAITVFSAHGVAEAVETHARERGLPTIDATCPLVTKVHKEAQRYEHGGYTLVLIGHEGHPEVEGTSGRVAQEVILVPDVETARNVTIATPDKLAYVTQTTLSVDDTQAIIAVLRERFPQIQGPDTRDICYATQNRQNAVRQLAQETDMILVVGAANSSNSNRLRDLAEEIGTRAYLIDDGQAINPAWLEGVARVGLTAGASAPEVLVEGVIARIQRLHPGTRVRTLEGIREDVQFKLPPEVLSPVLRHATG